MSAGLRSRGAPSRAGGPSERAHAWFEVRRSAIQGKGAFALRRIPKGTRIAEYEGERISNDEAARRYGGGSDRRHHTFLFAVAADVLVDGTDTGNASRFINHSCEPNVDILLDKKRIYFRARRKIEPDEELTYDYWYRVDPSYDADDVLRLYPCACGAKTCRGTLARPLGTPASPGGRTVGRKR